MHIYKMMVWKKFVREIEPNDNNTVRPYVHGCTFMYACCVNNDTHASIESSVVKCMYLHLSRCRRLRHIQMMMQQMMITMSRRAATAAIMIISGLAFHGCHQWCWPDVMRIHSMAKVETEQKQKTKTIIWFN